MKLAAKIGLKLSIPTLFFAALGAAACGHMAPKGGASASADVGVIKSCAALSETEMAKNAECSAVMTKTNTTPADMMAIRSCRAMSHEAMMADKSCTAVSAKHPGAL